MEEKKEQMRKDIMSFWDGTKEDMKKRKAFMEFMNAAGMGDNTLYVYMRGECRRMPFLKIIGLLGCIKEFQKKKR